LDSVEEWKRELLRKTAINSNVERFGSETEN